MDHLDISSTCDSIRNTREDHNVNYTRSGTVIQRQDDCNNMPHWTLWDRRLTIEIPLMQFERSTVQSSMDHLDISTTCDSIRNTEEDHNVNYTWSGNIIEGLDDYCNIPCWT
ncbi:hypothetical protein J6590_021741 [Homalodisca vitripennis]|nr:hypothetical protein J6590_021741 [Homalodisca vitripennis]